MCGAGVNAFLAANNVTARGNAGGFTGGGLHLQNTQHLQPGVPLSGITVENNSCAFAGGFAVFGGTYPCLADSLLGSYRKISTRCGSATHYHTESCLQ